MYWRFCLTSQRQQYGDELNANAMTQKFKVLSQMIETWLWVVTSWWYHSERVSGTARVAQFILHSNFYDMYSSSEMVNCAVSVEYWPYCNLWVHYMFDTCSWSTRPLSYTRLFKKMQWMSVRDLDKMKPFHGKKEWGFQIHSLERNDDNLSQIGGSETCRQTCSWCPLTR